MSPYVDLDLCYSVCVCVCVSTYLNLLGVGICALLRPEVSLGAPLHHLVLPAEGQPVGGEPGGLHEREERQLRPAIIREVHGRFRAGYSYAITDIAVFTTPTGGSL